jgi:hypothetical protein
MARLFFQRNSALDRRRRRCFCRLHRDRCGSCTLQADDPDLDTTTRNIAGLAICFGGMLGERDRPGRWFAPNRTSLRHAANRQRELAGAAALPHDIEVLSI